MYDAKRGRRRKRLAFRSLRPQVLAQATRVPLPLGLACAFKPEIVEHYLSGVSMMVAVLDHIKPSPSAPCHTGRDAQLFGGIGFSPRTEAPQMRENMSLLSFWGLVFSLIAVTLFVVIYSYQKNKNANRNIVEDLRQRSVNIYLAAETCEAETDSKKFRAAADEIERLRAETSVLFWLIIAMNAAVIIIFTLAYRIL
jgi:hypothetical protein